MDFLISLEAWQILSGEDSSNLNYNKQSLLLTLWFKQNLTTVRIIKINNKHVFKCIHDT